MQGDQVASYHPKNTNQNGYTTYVIKSVENLIYHFSGISIFIILITGAICLDKIENANYKFNISVFVRKMDRSLSQSWLLTFHKEGFDSNCKFVLSLLRLLTSFDQYLHYLI